MQINKLLLYFNLFFLQSYLIRFRIGGFPTNLQEVLISLQLAVFIFAIIKDKIFLQTLSNIKKHWIILSFLILTAVSLITVPAENQTDLIRHLKFLFFASILTFIFVETFKTIAEKKFALKIAGQGAIIFGLFSVIYNLLGFNTASDLRLLGPLDAAVYLGYHFTPFFLFFLIEFFENTKDKSSLYYAIILGILMLATLSMGSIAGSLIVILIYLFKRHQAKIFKNKIIEIGLAGICLIIFTAVFYTKILPTLETKYSSLDERGEIWQTSFKLLQEPKNIALGIGYGQFQQQYEKNVKQVLGREPLDYYVLQPHNIFLLFIFQFGIAGLIFLLICIYKNLRNIINCQKNSPLEFHMLANLILLYFFLHGLIDTPFFKNDLLIIFILLLELSLVTSLKPAHQTH